MKCPYCGKTIPSRKVKGAKAKPRKRARRLDPLQKSMLAFAEVLRGAVVNACVEPRGRRRPAGR